MKRKWLKVWACLLVVCMLMGTLAACGGNGEQSSTPSSSSQESKTPESTPDSAETTPSTEEEPQVVDDGTVFPAYDLGGVTLTLLAHNDLAAKNPDVEDIEDYEKADRQANLDRIEAKYNVNLEFVSPDATWDDMAASVVQAYTSGHPVADIMDAYYQMAGVYVTNDILYNYGDALKDSGLFNNDRIWSLSGKTFGMGSGMGGEGLYYNKDWIKRLGMEYTPAEMFDRGMWSYDDCYNYMKQMKDAMEENEYPLYVDPYYWMLFATGANGISIVSGDGQLNYCHDAFIESMEFLQKTVNDGLSVPGSNLAVYDENTGELLGYSTWGYYGNTFDQANTVAISHRAAWQAEGITNNGTFDLGFVPYPWGSNVTIGHTGEPGDYLTLSDNYAATYFDGQLITLTKGVEQKADPVGVMVMILDLMGWDSMMAAYEQPTERTGAGWLEDGTIDKELYFWSTDQERWEPFDMFVDSGIDLMIDPSGTVYQGKSIRSSMESFYNADMQALIDAGFASADKYTPFDIPEEE